MAKAKVVDFEHIVIFSSIIRPAANRFINVMLERIHGKRWNVIHKDLEYLKETYGIIVYEEQVSSLVHPDNFVLQVRGQSMIDEQIQDGDYIVVKKTAYTSNTPPPLEISSISTSYFQYHQLLHRGVVFYKVHYCPIIY